MQLVSGLEWLSGLPLALESVLRLESEWGLALVSRLVKVSASGLCVLRRAIGRRRYRLRSMCKCH